MNTHNGWIKLHRCLLDDAVCQKSAYFRLWVVLLLRAAHKEHEFIFNNQIHTLYPGQLITGRKKLSQQTGIPGTTIVRILKCFENGQRIKVKTTTKYSLITIINWEKYQSEASSLHSSGHQMDNKRSASGQPADTYKNEVRMKRMITNTGGVIIYHLNKRKYNGPMQTLKKPRPNSSAITPIPTNHYQCELA